MTYSKLKEKYFNYLPLIFIFASVTPFLETLGKSILYLILTLSILSKNIKIEKIDLRLFSIYLFLILFLSSFIDLLNNSGFTISKMNLFYSFNILVGFILSQIYTKDKILKFIENIVIAFLLIGLPLHFILLFKPDLINYFFEYNYGNTTHKTLFFLNTHISNGSYEGRFMSFAWEPGIMQMFLNISLYTRLTNKKNKFDIFSILIIIAIICTYSTAGYFILFLIFLFKGYFFNYKFILLLIFLSPFIFSAINQSIEYQLTYKLVNSNSFDGRYGRLFKMFTSWDFKDLFFGRGGVYYDNELKNQDLGGFDSFTNIIQRYGILFFLILSINVIVNNSKIFTLIILLTFLSQPIWSAPILIFFSFKGITSK